MATHKVLITGASGLLGRAIYQEFKENSQWSTLGLAFSRAKNDLIKCDITREEEVAKIINEFKPDVIVHSAAEKRPDIVENQPEVTRKLNVDATSLICKQAEQTGASVIYISTDYVFDGTKPPHKPEDPTNPLNAYGKSKLEGEEATLAVNSANIILRVPLLYGDIENYNESAVTYMFPFVKDHSKEFVVSNYEKRYPTHCRDVAYVIWQIAERKLQEPSLAGIFQWSGAEEMTKYEMCVVMADVFNLPKDHIKPDSTPTSGAVRPYNAHLHSGRLEDLGIGKRRSYKDGITEVLRPFVN